MAKLKAKKCGDVFGGIYCRAEDKLPLDISYERGGAKVRRSSLEKNLAILNALSNHKLM
ncbi:MAG TPA: hypothetical protein VK253_02580 [Candidatus Binatia bacterium]|nr:hypothetical protein [Candidatus Binatia bacterium]